MGGHQPEKCGLERDRGLKFADLEMLATESGENAKMKKNGIGAGEL